MASHSTTEPVLTGGCLCGVIRFRLTAPPLTANYCHCTRCQRRTGTAASAQVRIDPGTFVLESGGEHIRGWVPPDGGYEKCFCAQCGSHLFSRPPGAEEPFGVRLGAFDGDPGARPMWRQFVAYAAAWEPIPDDGLERFPEGRPPAA